MGERGYIADVVDIVSLLVINSALMPPDKIGSRVAQDFTGPSRKARPYASEVQIPFRSVDGRHGIF
jgi:hypothetical protein